MGFPGAGRPFAAVSRYLVRDWWERLAERAKLPVEARRGWHSFRRKFATELSGASPTELMALGGWRNYGTIVKCYMRPDEDRLRGALHARRSDARSTARRPRSDSRTGTLNGHT